MLEHQQKLRASISSSARDHARASACELPPLVKRAPILPPSGGNIGNSNEFKPKYIKIELEALEYYARRKEILLAGISKSMHIIAS